MKTNKRKEPEYEIQVDIVKYLKQLMKSKKIIYYFAVINEASYEKSPKHTKQGLQKGTSDLVILLQNHTLFLELKKDRPILKSGKKSKVNYQKDCQEYFQSKVDKTVHNSYEISYGFEESKQMIDDYCDKYPIIDYSEHFEL